MWANSLYLGKLVVSEQIGCIREIGCIWAKLVVFGQTGWIWSNMVLFGHIDCRWSKLVVFGQIGIIRAE